MVYLFLSPVVTRKPIVLCINFLLCFLLCFVLCSSPTLSSAQVSSVSLVEDHDTSIPSQLHMDQAILMRIKTMLIQYEKIPSRQQFLLVANMDILCTHLIFLYQHSDKKSKMLRRNSLAVLGYFPNTQVKSFLQSVVQNPSTETYLLRGALLAYAYAYASHPLDVLHLIVHSALSHHAISIRKTAIRILAHIQHPQAHIHLKKAWQIETHPRLKKYIRKWLNQSP